MAGGVLHNKLIEQRFLFGGKGAKFKAALPFAHDTEGNLIFYFEVSDIFNRDPGQEEGAVDKYINSIGITKPLILVKISNCHSALADIHNSPDRRGGLVGDGNGKILDFVARMLSSFTLLWFCRHNMTPSAFNLLY
jgi:hypothetical protein